MKGTMLDMMADAEIIKFSFIIRPLCLIGKIKKTGRLQDKADDKGHYTPGVSNILCEF